MLPLVLGGCMRWCLHARRVTGLVSGVVVTWWELGRWVLKGEPHVHVAPWQSRAFPGEGGFIHRFYVYRTAISVKTTVGLEMFTVQETQTIDSR